MFKQIHSMLEEGINPLGAKAAGVEMDETYMGGRRKGHSGRPGAGRQNENSGYRPSD